MHFILETTNEIIPSQSGLSLVGELLSKTQLRQNMNNSHMKNISSPCIAHSDVAFAYLGLLCQGKNDFDHIEEYREDDFFELSMQINTVPSSPTLRQRLDQAAKTSNWCEIILEESAKLFRTMSIPITPIALEEGGPTRLYAPLDIDVSPFDNSNTKKEGVSYTYKGHVGYAPIFAYLGKEGFALNTELREGSQHCQNNTVPFIEKSIAYAKQITNHRLLLRLDSGNDSADNINLCLNTNCDFIIKRNLRKESTSEWLQIAKEQGSKDQVREGKFVYRGSVIRHLKKVIKPIRIVYEVIERTIDRMGQILLIPEIEVHTYSTSLPDSPHMVKMLYQDHGTSEQFHSEIKTDLDMERLPSGKFATNNLILHFAILAYNLLKIIGQESLKRDDTPLRKKAQRRRVRTVIQNLIMIASKMIRSSRRHKLRFSSTNTWFRSFQRIYSSFILTPCRQ
jgi:hypothetical protein